MKKKKNTLFYYFNLLGDPLNAHTSMQREEGELCFNFKISRQEKKEKSLLNTYYSYL